MKSISFESLKDKALKNVDYIVNRMPMKNPGEYLNYRTCQMLGIEKLEGRLTIYDLTNLKKSIIDAINRCDVRMVEDLLDVLRKCSIGYPSWLNKGYDIALDENGWMLYEKETDY